MIVPTTRSIFRLACLYTPRRLERLAGISDTYHPISVWFRAGKHSSLLHGWFVPGKRLGSSRWGLGRIHLTGTWLPDPSPPENGSGAKKLVGLSGKVSAVIGSSTPPSSLMIFRGTSPSLGPASVAFRTTYCL